MEQSWRWTLGMVYVIAVAVIWIVASFVVQSVVGSGVSPFLITYICNSLFVIYIPIVEGSRYGERWLKRKWNESQSEDQKMGVEKENLLLETVNASNLDLDTTDSEKIVSSPSSEGREVSVVEVGREDDEPQEPHNREWTRLEIAKVGLLICPFWFIAQFTFNLSLKYTTVTVSTSPAPPPQRLCQILLFSCFGALLNEDLWPLLSLCRILSLPPFPFSCPSLILKLSWT